MASATFNVEATKLQSQGFVGCIYQLH